MEPLWAFECPNCKKTREFLYSGDFTLDDGTKAHMRSCDVCGYRRYFDDGVPFTRPQRRGVTSGFAYIHSKIISPDNPTSENPEINLKTPLDRFLIETSNLSTYEKGLKFEKFCQTLLEAMGYGVEHTGQRGDRGVDLKAVRQESIGSQTLVVQCKHQESVSAEVVIQILGMVNAANANQGLVITTGSFTADAKNFAGENPAIEIIDGLKLAELVDQYTS